MLGFMFIDTYPGRLVLPVPPDIDLTGFPIGKLLERVLGEVHLVFFTAFTVVVNLDANFLVAVVDSEVVVVTHPGVVRVTLVKLVPESLRDGNKVLAVGVVLVTASTLLVVKPGGLAPTVTPSLGHRGLGVVNGLSCDEGGESSDNDGKLHDDDNESCLRGFK